MDVTALATALRFLGVLAVGCVQVGVGVMVVEVTPTTARASAVGLCAAHAALGEILATFMTAVVGRILLAMLYGMTKENCFFLGFLFLLSLANSSFLVASPVFADMIRTPVDLLQSFPPLLSLVYSAFRYMC